MKVELLVDKVCSEFALICLGNVCDHVFLGSIMHFWVEAI